MAEISQEQTYRHISAAHNLGPTMDEKKWSELTRMGWEIHGAVEEAYLCNPATKKAPAE